MISSKNNYKLSNEFIKKLAEISAGYISPEMLDDIIQVMENEISLLYFTYAAESNLLRIISRMYDKTSFLMEMVKYPNYAEVVLSIAANSNYLSDILVVNPEYFYWVINPSTQDIKLSEQKFRLEISTLLKSYKSLNAKVNALRTLKRKEILRIGVKDILGKADLETITLELSILANVIAGELFNLCYQEVLRKYELENLEREFCLIALGKLGGGELNYSSDIDLIIFYDKNSELNSKKYYNEILTEAVYLFVEHSSAITGKGFIYRVDFRLRPDGRTSALCRSIDEYLDYYEIRGEDWERQMLLKAGFVCGSKPMYEKFISYLQPFIYPVTFSVSPAEQIKKLKANIEKNLKDDDNIKLVPGGIRDIEFSVQALLLLNGGVNKNLHTGNTLDAIQKLEANGFLSKSESKTFRDAYIFYRKIEHYLQLMNDMQTHSIPQEGETLEKMSAFLGFANSHSFKEKVFEYRKSVQAIFNSIIGIESKALISSRIGSLIKFENKSRAEKDLQYLREGIGLLGQKQFDKKSIIDFEAIEPVLEEYLKASLNPDLVLQNFVRVIRPVNFPSIWYKEFQNKKFFNSFLHLCEFCQKAIDLFAEDDNLREYFITRKAFVKLTRKETEQLSARKLLLAVSIQFSLKLIDVAQASLIMSIFFRQKIKSITQNFVDENSVKINFAIASLGSFGAKEMSLSSDIDLVFIAKDMDNYTDIQPDFQKLLSIIKDELRPIEVDCRLRPEGKSSNLAWDLKSYQAYVQGRARIWELQSFCKLDFIAGNKRIINSLAGSINKRIRSERNEGIKKEIFEMRKRFIPHVSSSASKFFNIKKSSGGIADIDFLVQYLVLTSGNYLKLRSKGILNSLSALAKNDELETLKGNYIFLKHLDLTINCIFNSSSAVLPTSESKLNSIVRAMEFKTMKEFNSRLNEVISSNQKNYKKYLG